jgi:hypothetical protein
MAVMPGSLAATTKRSSPPMSEAPGVGGLAHEIGHWTHHRGLCLVCRAEDINRGGDNRPVMEKTADRYAANLLMPPYLFRQAIGEHKRLSFQAVKAVAEGFRVSRISAAIQTIGMRHTPAPAGLPRPKGRKWFSRSTDGASHWLPRDDLDAASFAFDVLFGGKADCLTPRKVGADAWFDRRGADRYELREQTWRTPSTISLPGQLEAFAVPACGACGNIRPDSGKCLHCRPQRISRDLRHGRCRMCGSVSAFR